MAKQTTVIIFDDLDGTEGASAVSFAYCGTSYEIDLSEDQAKLGAALAPYILAARKIGRASTPTGDGTSTARASRRRDLAAVRAWARQNSLEVSDRGRVPGEVQKAYDAAHRLTGA
jgi:hypothetical protein